MSDIHHFKLKYDDIDKVRLCKNGLFIKKKREPLIIRLITVPFQLYEIKLNFELKSELCDFNGSNFFCCSPTKLLSFPLTKNGRNKTGKVLSNFLEITRIEGVPKYMILMPNLFQSAIAFQSTVAIVSLKEGIIQRYTFLTNMKSLNYSSNMLFVGFKKLLCISDPIFMEVKTSIILEEIAKMNVFMYRDYLILCGQIDKINVVFLYNSQFILIKKITNKHQFWSICGTKYLYIDKNVLYSKPKDLLLHDEISLTNEQIEKFKVILNRIKIPGNLKTSLVLLLQKKDKTNLELYLLSITRPKVFSSTRKN